MKPKIKTKETGENRGQEREHKIAEQFTMRPFAPIGLVCYHSPMEKKRRQNGGAPNQAAQSGLHVATRTTMYVVRLLLFVIMGLIICIAAFVTAQRYANLYILVNEGMALRADCIIADGAQNDLEEYFTLSCLSSDRVSTDTTYDNYNITSYNYDLAIEKVSVLPWSMTAQITATERVTLRGSVNTNLLEEGQSASDYPLPEWTPVRYRISFLNSNERWYISSVEVLTENPDQAPLGTPDPNQSPIPAATPTPAITEAPTLAPSTHSAGDVTTLAPAAATPAA